MVSYIAYKVHHLLLEHTPGARRPNRVDCPMEEPVQPAQRLAINSDPRIAIVGQAGHFRTQGVGYFNFTSEEGWLGEVC